MINVFEIERYATKDGPGIRTVIFLKGCNLRCSWCQNPESQKPSAQVMYYKNRCAGCGRCVQVCPEGAVVFSEQFGFITDYAKCSRCFKCIDACFYDARQMTGRGYEEAELMKKILADRSFYDESGGGVTFSGGEPLLQHDAVRIIASECRKEGIHTAIETAGAVKWEVFESLLDVIDLFFIDLKHLNTEKHKDFTGVGNEQILENIIRLSERRNDVIIRIPVIPGFNHNEDDINDIFRSIASKTKIRNVELLPFHRIGSGKYSGLGMTYGFADTANLADAECDAYKKSGLEYGINIRIGAE